MGDTLKAIIDAVECPTCEARKGHECRNAKGQVMPRNVHTLRMICPICRKYYEERSGNGFRHFSQAGNRWCRLPPAGETVRCQFCEKDSPKKSWKEDKCPLCGRVYDAILAQEGDD